jgi:integrase
MLKLLLEQFRMASVHKKPHSRSPFWFAAFRGADGKRIQKSTKTKDRKLALKLAVEWEEATHRARQGSLVEAQVRKVMNEILEIATGQSLHFATARAFFQDWLRDKNESKMGRTGEKYSAVVRSFLSSLGRRADQNLAAISPADLRTWRSILIGEKLSAATINGAVKIISAAFNRARRLGYIEDNPCFGLDPLRDEDRDQKDCFSEEQILRMLHFTRGTDWEGVILIGVNTGLRRGDLTNLAWSNIHFDSEGHVTIQVKTSKTRAHVVLPLHPDAVSWIESRPRGVGKAPVFPTLAGKSGNGKSGISMQFRRIMERADVVGRIIRTGAGKGRTTSSLTLHSLRNTFISRLANAGVAEDLRMKLVGHHTKAVHRGYTQHETQTLRNAVLSVPGVADIKRKI